jgi:hypothetical protein
MMSEKPLSLAWLYAYKTEKDHEPCGYSDNFHETIKAKRTPLLFYHAHHREGEVPNNVQRGPIGMHKFTTKEGVMQSFFFVKPIIE